MPRKFYFFPLILVVVALIGSYFTFLRSTDRRTRLSSETPAFITRTDVRRDVDPETGKEHSVDVLVTFQYEIGGNKYERTVRKSKTESLSFVPWGKAKVCYDPNDLSTLESPELFPADHICGN